MFTTFIVQPIFNLLVLIYGLLPGHNFGLALIIFTIVIRLLLWPLLKKQLHQTKAMRKMQPQLKEIKQQTKGDKQKEMQLTMELYKERGINPYASLPVTLVQAAVLFGLYLGLRKVIVDPHSLVTFAYPALQHLSWMKELAADIHRFDNTLFGVVHLNKAALNSWGIYWPAMLLVIGSAAAQFFQSKQLLPAPKDSKSLRDILRSAGDGKQADQSEVSAAVGRSTLFLLPAFIFIVSLHFASALSLYWFIGGLIAFLQQSIVLRDDETELEDLADKPSRDVAAIPEAEVVPRENSQKPTTPKPKKRTSAAKKRRK